VGGEDRPTSSRLASQKADVASVHGFQMTDPGTRTSQGKATVVSPEAPAPREAGRATLCASAGRAGKGTGQGNNGRTSRQRHCQHRASATMQRASSCCLTEHGSQPGDGPVVVRSRYAEQERQDNGRARQDARPLRDGREPRGRADAAHRQCSMLPADVVLVLLPSNHR
jgi:hypothetical protein